MEKHLEIKTCLSKEEIGTHIQIWEQASISIVDIRHDTLTAKHTISNYQLPSNIFLYIIGDRALVRLEEQTICVDRFGLFHASKAARLSVQPVTTLEYYIIFYKIGAPLIHKKEFLKLMSSYNPFLVPYGFTPKDPIFFAKQLQRMYMRWQKPSRLDRFYEKISFYQILYKIYEELEQEKVYLCQPDVLEVAKQYLKTNYNQGISILELSKLLGISSGHLRNTFKARYGYSPQEYITRQRIEEAKHELVHSNARLKEIANHTGFYDEYQFSRLFKKFEGITPLSYRVNCTSKVFDSSIDLPFDFYDNEKSQVSYDKLEKEGVNIMLEQIKNKTMLASAIIVALMLSACGQTAKESKQDETNASSAVAIESNTQLQTKGNQEQMRTIKADNGDIQIPANPQRILATLMEGDLIAFGVQPIAVMSVGMDLEKTTYYDEIKDLEVINADDPEAVMELDPDVIITYSEENAEKFSKIAPTLVISASGMEIRERTRFIGELLNQQDKAEELIQALEEKVSSLRDKIEQNGLTDKTVTIMEGVGTKGEVWLTTSGRGSIPLYDLLGFQMPKRVQEELTGDDGNWLNQWLQVSMEVLPEYVGDYVFFSDQISLEEIGLTGSEVWNRIPAVVNNHVYMTSFPYFFPQDIYSVMKQLDVIEELLFAQ